MAEEKISGIIADNIENIVTDVLENYSHGKVIDKENIFHLDNDEIIKIIGNMQKIILPWYYHNKVYKVYTVRNHISMLLEDVAYNLKKQIAIVLRYNEEVDDSRMEVIDNRAEEITVEFLKQIPQIRDNFETDLQAAYDGDPSAGSFNEIIYAFPGVYAIMVNRIAHELYKLNVPLIPRIMTEYAHSITGIDIHPGVQIGKYFFIDHGTGIVIGETTVIGNNVKIYQGVTLGALSTRGGQKLKGIKRHPTIGDNVTIYSGAAVLGGETV
ncbi:MAG: serine acetyltransferase, partial [Firmicutes bacterium]|nr:serine acetyltransferase [Bacillota bacterium]